MILTDGISNNKKSGVNRGLLAALPSNDVTTVLICPVRAGIFLKISIPIDPVYFWG